MSERYIRQIPLVSEEGQERLAGSKVAVIGCGGLGCNVITQLAMAGVGEMVLVDKDAPSESDLNRQFIYAGRRPAPKAELAAEWVGQISERTKAVPMSKELNSGNVGSVLKGCDIAVDCLDNNESRLVLNAGVLSKGIPLVHGAADGPLGQVTVVVPGRTACLECFLPEVRPGIIPAIGSVVSVIGGIEIG
ncbi:MAG: HesA/MoeB/ThiF family protein, partial [Candidatus Methanomethylophilaceae archaeon]|nr:HesA/MoeB/ThiF family protein [Candidatus Methanomethylophilaceae archaeon]